VCKIYKITLIASRLSLIAISPEPLHSANLSFNIFHGIANLIALIGGGGGEISIFFAFYHDANALVLLSSK
jgi:hypothetical protein